MKHSWKKMAVSCLMVLALVATLCLGCGEDEEEEKVTIYLGHLTDLTGVAASALIPIMKALDANVRYFNEVDPVPGVELEVVRYNTNYDPSRAKPGYDWIRDHGADVIYTEMPEMAEGIVQFAEGDKTVVICHPGTKVLADAQGWVFCLNPTSSAQMRSLMKYVSDEWEAAGKYDSVGKPKIGTAGWSTPYGNDVKLGAEYCLDYPEKFDYVGSYLAPAGTVTWSGEVEALKDCDYIVLTTPGALQPSTFAAEFLAKGHTAKWLGLDSLVAYWDVMLEKVGSEAMDGSLMGQFHALWVYDCPVVEHLKQLAYTYYPDEAEELISGNCGFLGGGGGTYFLIGCIRAAIEEVGAENFDGQAFYDMAVKFRPRWEGYPEEVGWSPTDRLSSKWQIIYEYSHAAGDFEVATDWVEVIEE